MFGQSKTITVEEAVAQTAETIELIAKTKSGVKIVSKKDEHADMAKDFKYQCGYSTHDANVAATKVQEIEE